MIPEVWGCPWGCTGFACKAQNITDNMLELAEQHKFTEKQLLEFAKAKPPADYEEAMTRPDAKLYELATAIELSAFDKYVLRYEG